MKLRPIIDSQWSTSIGPEHTIVLPPELSEQVGWGIGTQLYYSLQKNGSIIISSNPSPPEK